MGDFLRIGGNVVNRAAITYVEIRANGRLSIHLTGHQMIPVILRVTAEEAPRVLAWLDLA